VEYTTTTQRQEYKWSRRIKIDDRRQQTGDQKEAKEKNQTRILGI
jgi:hypothetical protein